MRPQTRMLIVLWVISSVGIAGVITAMAYKPGVTTIQKAKPVHNVDRLLKTDKWVKPPVSAPKATPEIPSIRPRKYWYA